MERLKCPSCGKESPSTLSKCPHCGDNLTDTWLEEDLEYLPKVRNGFTTFYLWWGMVVNTILGLAYFATIFTSKGLWTAYDPMWTRILGFVSSGILVVGYLSLIKWKKSGFYILVFMGCISLFQNLLSEGPISLATFFPVGALLILYAVLQIKKDSISCWEQLS